MPEPSITLLLNSIQEVLAHNLGGGLRTLAFLLLQHRFQLLQIPISVRLLSLLIAVISVDILLSGLASIEVQIVTVLAASSLIATTSLEERTEDRFGVLTESKLDIKPTMYTSHLRDSNDSLEKIVQLLLLLLLGITSLLSLQLTIPHHSSPLYGAAPPFYCPTYNYSNK